MPQLTQSQALCSYGTAVALAVVTSSRADASTSLTAKRAVVAFQNFWNGGHARTFVDAELRPRGFAPVIPDRLVVDGAYGGNTARALVALLWAFDRAGSRPGTAWAQDMVDLKTWAKLAIRADVLPAVMVANAGTGDPISAAGNDIYRIEKTTVDNAQVLPLVQERIRLLTQTLGPWSTSSTIDQAVTQATTVVDAAQAPAMAPAPDANATVATARVDGASTVVAVAGSDQVVTDLGEMEVVGNRPPPARGIPTAVYVAGGAALLLGIGFAVVKASEKRA